MTIEEFMNVHHQRPFVPYTIHLTDGRGYLVTHPDFLSRSPSGRTIIVHTERDGFSLLNLNQVADLEVQGQSTSDATRP